ncbi:DMT family transporter [Paractinoplanes rishiriensis]|uniref:Cation transporter n=1 Tax=Paractinoplanes rishiriensis TaxID=1050105 RepID=A0A919JVC5_9ACTN|nr:SMR family transporter [Actinoplanes rishiriensis]GIE95518.1 cation transporter [Actinoplanes rishiriensis]
MRKWLLLAAAILLEVSGTLALRAAIDTPGWYALVAVGYAGSFVALTYLLRLGMGVGVAYGIWAACGVALTAVFASVIFGDPLTGTMVAGIVLIAAGVLCVELGSQAAQARRSA